MSKEKLSVVDVVNLAMVGAALLNGVFALLGIQAGVQETQTAIAAIPEIAAAAANSAASAVAVATEVKQQVDVVLSSDQVLTPVEVDAVRLGISGAILAFTKPLTSIFRIFRR